MTTYNPNKRDRVICEELIHQYFEAQRLGQKATVKEILDRLEHNIHDTPAPECPRCRTNAYMILEGNSWYCNRPTPDDISSRCYYHIHAADKHEVKPCVFCGEPVEETYHNRWIHPECHNKRSKAYKPEICIVCGNPIETPRYGKARCDVHQREFRQKHDSKYRPKQKGI